MLKNNLGFPRIGFNRELKKACEKYWRGKISREELFETGFQIRSQNLKMQHHAGIDLIPCNDFSFYDHILDTSLMVGNIPERYNKLLKINNSEIDLYFAMARGYQDAKIDIIPLEMTKWFDTNYHYIVPEFYKNQTFHFYSKKVINEFIESKEILGKPTKPVIIGPVSYLLLGKEKGKGFHRIDLINNLLPVYIEILRLLGNNGAEWIQLDEPFLVMDLGEKEKEAFTFAYDEIHKELPNLKILLTTYFEGLRDNAQLAASLPVKALHLDLIKAPQQLDEVINLIPSEMFLSLGIVDGRNIWKTDYQKSISIINRAIEKIGKERIIISPSCSLLHIPYDLDFETELNPDIKNWLAFAKQKLYEIDELYRIINGEIEQLDSILQKNQNAINSRRYSPIIHKENIKQKVASIKEEDTQRKSNFTIRQKIQNEKFKFPIFPTTTIGSFPQTEEIRKLRAHFKKREITQEEYEAAIETEIEKVIRWQEEIGLDVLVHGEFERTDMVEYFAEQLEGFAITKNGWVQSYGSRCVKPPIIYGDVERTKDITVHWTKFAQSLTKKPVKGMLTGPITILQWSFVRDDLPRSETLLQIALAIRDEVKALENTGINIIQIDEPALREGLPLRKSDWQEYLNWAVKAFRIASSIVKDETQIHTHMCYSEFNDIVESIADLDADVITIEAARSQMELLEAFTNFEYPNEIGPGVYDIHSQRIPSVKEILTLLEKASSYFPIRNIWVNPDCGLKTRGWKETEVSLKNMVEAAKIMRNKFNS